MAEAKDLPSQRENKSETPAPERKIEPAQAAASGLAEYPDIPLTIIPKAPLSPKFVVEHRTALKAKAITARGVIVRTWFAGKAGEASGATPSPGAHPQPRLFLADESTEERDQNYDLMVLLGEGDEDYATGETAEIKGIVESSKVAVYLRKID